MAAGSKVTVRQIIEAVGATYLGTQDTPRGQLVYFQDPETHSTLAMYRHAIVTVKDVQKHLDNSRAGFFNGIQKG